MYVKPLAALFLLAGITAQAHAQSSVEIATGIPAGLPGVSATPQQAPAQPPSTAALPAATPAQKAMAAQAAAANPAANPEAQAVPMIASYKPRAQPNAEVPNAAALAGSENKPSSAPAVKLPASGVTVSMLSKIQLQEIEKNYAKQLSDLAPQTGNAQSLNIEDTKKVAPPKPYLVFSGGPIGAEEAHFIFSDGETVQIPVGKTVRGIHVASISNGVVKVNKVSSKKKKVAKGPVQTVVAGEYLK